jgi:putative flavoprotein involved in K+ transport
MDDVYDALVIGAGQAGLAAGYHLKRAGLTFTILEAGPRPAGSWPRYYDSLTLFSPTRYSSLPGLPFPGDPNHYPVRDEVIHYLEAYASHFRLPVVTGTRVERIDRDKGTFAIHTADGSLYQARTVIAATGAFNSPNVPSIPGQEIFKGRVIHSSEYHHPRLYHGDRVVVVGAGNSAVQIAVEVAQEADVTLATRGPVKFRPQRIWGRDIHFWGKWTGLDTLPIGNRLGTCNGGGVLDAGFYQAAVALGRPDQRPMFSRFTENGVVWSDRTSEQVDVVILATGYKPNVSYLRHIGVNDQEPIHHRGGASLDVPGLYYVGLACQRSHASATLRGVGADAHYIVKRLTTYLRHNPLS